MASKGENAYAVLVRSVGTSEGSGEWFQVDQERINAFADVTLDQQFIHVDPEQCKALSPWGVPIAHGFLTLSLLTHLAGSVPQDPAGLDGVVMGINYGFDKVRFLTPVKVDQRVRATSVLKDVKLKDPNTIDITRTFTVEIEGETKPALIADWITRAVYSG